VVIHTTQMSIEDVTQKILDTVKNSKHKTLNPK